MQTGFYFDQARCTGRFTRTAACKLEDGVNVDRGKYSQHLVASRSIACYGCVQPVCVSASPISKRGQRGIVVIGRETCLVTGHSQVRFEVRPHDSPQSEAEHDAKLHMYNLCMGRCPDRTKPICVDGRPAKACRYDGMIRLAGAQQVTASTPEYSRQYSRALPQDVHERCNRNWDAIERSLTTIYENRFPTE